MPMLAKAFFSRTAETGLVRQSRHHVLRCDVAEDDLASSHALPHEVMNHIDVLAPRRLDWILDQLESTLVISIDHHGVQLDAQRR